MKKSTFLILSIVALALLAVGYGMIGASVTTTTTGSTVTATSNASPIALALVGIGGLVSLVTWILGLVKTVQLKRWGWFVAVLLLGTIGTLIYGIAGSEQPRA